ncbi:hypothetical protein UPYG_G00016100 [Umbra pygmaea]|uniref:RING-type domain-containing protein n=1 Tax=Umbra pygmaea TaxID=75934 RepID=A0ABD0Y709_UMBPY
MANNFQNVTLSLTLPISCQICLGKVRQPVICANNHVFCSCCMDIWLKKAGQCPTCRVPITADNPCREIIGGTNESESNESHSVNKRLRKTRGELLLREYEDEIEGLLKENEDLRIRNQSLESQLRTVLDPCTITARQQENNNIDPDVLEEWSKKMRAASDRYSKIKVDVDKLKEANKMLRSQNFDLVQENMRLKAEVASRSPQKFGRYTVAALEAKIQQYQRDMDHLKKALERSDRYIEELEGQQGQDSQGHTDACPESTTSGAGEAETRVNHEQVSSMKRRLSDLKNASICTSSLEGESEMVSPHHSHLLATRVGHGAPGRGHRVDIGVGEMETDNLSAIAPSTPSSAFRSLSLSPGGADDRKLGYKALTYLRRLSFEDCGVACSGVSSGEPKRSGVSNTLSAEEPKRSGVSTTFTNGVFPSSAVEAGSSTSNTVFWGTAWQSTRTSDMTLVTSVTSPNHSGAQQVNTALGHSERSPDTDQASTLSEDLAELGTEPMSSEASMDAAYLDKISELDSMMLEGTDGLSRRGSADSHLSSGSKLSLTSIQSAYSPDLTLETGLDVTLVPELDGCSSLLDADPDHDGGAETQAAGPVSLSLNNGQVKRDVELPGRLTGTGSSPIPVCESQARASCEVHTASTYDPSQSDQLSVDPLTTVKSGPGGSLGSFPNEEGDVPSGGVSSGCSIGTPVRKADKESSSATPGQAAKRKSHSPFNSSSPYKHSKFV